MLWHAPSLTCHESIVLCLLRSHLPLDSRHLFLRETRAMSKLVTACSLWAVGPSSAHRVSSSSLCKPLLQVVNARGQGGIRQCSCLQLVGQELIDVVQVSLAAGRLCPQLGCNGRQPSKLLLAPAARQTQLTPWQPLDLSPESLCHHSL